MQTGHITQYFDVASLSIDTFWLLFFGLIVYLRREDKREGYPLVAEGTGELVSGLFPATPPKKTYLLQDGSTLTLPREPNERTLALKPVAGQLGGTPSEPTGNPLVDAVGPASYTLRQDHPEHSWEGEPRILPLRAAKAFYIDPRDPDIRGWDVVGADGNSAGTVTEAWVDVVEPQVVYYEVSIAGGSTVLVPARLAVLNEDTSKLVVQSITAAQFANVPRIKNPNQVTLLEEDKITGYFAGGKLYATPDRQEPLV